MLLVKFSRDWADEFNCDGFRLFRTQEEWDAHLNRVKEAESFYFGTNEGWEDEDLSDSFETFPVSAEVFDTIGLAFPEALGHGYGIFPDGYQDED